MTTSTWTTSPHVPICGRQTTPCHRYFSHSNGLLSGAVASFLCASFLGVQMTRHTCKVIAGKIVPAIATSTSSVCGLVCMELLKLVQGKPMHAHRNCHVNLGSNISTFYALSKAKVAKGGFDAVMDCVVNPYKPASFTKWDKFVVRKGDISLAALIDAVQQQHQVRITLIECLKASKAGCGIPLFGGVTASDSAVLGKRVTELLQTKYPELNIVRPSVSSVVLEISAENAAGEDVLVPLLHFYWS